MPTADCPIFVALVAAAVQIGDMQPTLSNPPTSIGSISLDHVRKFLGCILFSRCSRGNRCSGLSRADSFKAAKMLGEERHHLAAKALHAPEDPLGFYAGNGHEAADMR